MAGSPPDFATNAFTLALADADGEVYRAVVPAGGLVASRDGKRFSFKDKSGTLAGGLASLKLIRRKDGSYRWNARATHVDLDAAESTYLDVGAQTGSAECWADSQPCTLKGNGKRLECKS